MDLIFGLLFGTIIGCDGGRDSVGLGFGRRFVLVKLEDLDMVDISLTMYKQLR